MFNFFFACLDNNYCGIIFIFINITASSLELLLVIYFSLFVFRT